jgi:cysteine desulfurase
MATPEIPAYFDNHATTAVDPRVLHAMLPTFEHAYGNPESAHAFGWRARVLVERARELTSRMIGAATHEIEFTSGATESIQRAILGVLNKPNLHIVTVSTEHKATLDACTEAVRLGHEITILQTDREGRVTAQQIIEALRPNTVLVSLMHGNNEIGTLHPISEIGSALRSARPDVFFHVDAAQTAGKHEIDVDNMHIDLLSLSAHKFHGPKGIGALYVRSSPGRRVHLHEQRHGTPNVSGIVGLGAACEIAHIEGARDRNRMIEQRDLILSTLEEKIGRFSTNGIHLNGPRADRLCNNISLTFEGVEQDQLMLALKDIAYSSASACSGPTKSHVLKAIGQPADNPFLTTVRFGLSRLTDEEDVSHLIERLIQGVRTTREISSAYDSTTKPVRKT